MLWKCCPTFTPSMCCCCSSCVYLREIYTRNLLVVAFHMFCKVGDILIAKATTNFCPECSHLKVVLIDRKRKSKKPKSSLHTQYTICICAHTAVSSEYTCLPACLPCFRFYIYTHTHMHALHPSIQPPASSMPLPWTYRGPMRQGSPHVPCKVQKSFV